MLTVLEWFLLHSPFFSRRRRVCVCACVGFSYSVLIKWSMKRILDTFSHSVHCQASDLYQDREEYNKNASCFNGNCLTEAFRTWISPLLEKDWCVWALHGEWWLLFDESSDWFSRSNALQPCLYSEVTFFIQSSTRLCRHLINDQAVHSST